MHQFDLVQNATENRLRLVHQHWIPLTENITHTKQQAIQYSKQQREWHNNSVLVISSDPFKIEFCCNCSHLPPTKRSNFEWERNSLRVSLLLVPTECLVLIFLFTLSNSHSVRAVTTFASLTSIWGGSELSIWQTRDMAARKLSAILQIHYVFAACQRLLMPGRYASDLTLSRLRNHLWCTTVSQEKYCAYGNSNNICLHTQFRRAG